MLLSIGFCSFWKNVNIGTGFGSRVIKHPQFLMHATYLIPSLMFGFIAATLSEKSRTLAWSHPPNREIMGSLQSVSHEPGTQFKGRVATFTGMMLEDPVNWLDLARHDNQIREKFNNDFRTNTLWVNSIPTLTEYSSHISPRFYFVTTRLFGKSGDKQLRTMMTLRNVDIKNLELFGIRYLIMDTPVEGLLVDTYEDSGTLRIYSYELENPNLGNWSPTKVIVNENPFETIRLLKSREFNAQGSVVLDKPINVQLSPAYNIKFAVDTNEYRLSATSDAYSLLVLPIEYSSCFDIEAKSTAAFGPQISIANLLLISVLFEKDVDLRLRYKNGPFVNSDCRLNDYFAFKTLLDRYEGESDGLH